MAEDKNQEDADNFGLPDIEYKPLEELDSSKSNEEVAPAEEETSTTQSYSHEKTSESNTTYYEDEEENSTSGVIIVLIVGLVLLVGGFLTYKYVWIPKREKAKLAQLAIERAEASKKNATDSLARVAEEDRLKREAAANAKPAVGTIETLTERTGRYYVVVSSSVDGDLANDKATKLSAEGKSIKIIPPFGKWKYYRLCIGDFDSFASAQSSADASKTDFGDALWVLKY
jgi:hypothetical protein